MAFPFNVSVCRKCEEVYKLEKLTSVPTLGLCPTCEHESEGLAEQLRDEEEMYLDFYGLEDEPEDDYDDDPEPPERE